jgi:hypothetical protein
MSKKKKRRKGASAHSGIQAHERRGATLIPPLGKHNIQMLDFERDLLPEHLWLAALADTYSLESAYGPFNKLLDAVDAYWPDTTNACLGYITDFGSIPVDDRQDFKREYRDLIRKAFHEPIGRILAFFPDCPAHWLVDLDALEEGGSLDPEVELARLRRLVVDLLPAKDLHSGHLRTIPFGRDLKHGKTHFLKDLPVLELLPRYPNQCTEEEKYRVQSFVRMSMNMKYEHTERYKTREWPKHFWRHNYDLVPCRPTNLPIRGSRPVTQDEAPRLIEALEWNSQRARAYLEQLAAQLPCDLYDPTKDEILFGLFARATRLFVLMTEDANLWARDTAGIMLRCLADTAITFSYLALAGTNEDFRRFREYGEGQEKLLMLHLQDSYPDSSSLEGRTSKAVSEELGSFVPEVLNIELGHWTKQDTRRLAAAAGLERFYRLVYAPSSSDLHGTWMSLKHSNLSRCAEPLHRFHRLPAYTEPPVYVTVMQAAQELYEHSVSVAIDRLRYPAFEPALRRIMVESDETTADNPSTADDAAD